MSPLRIAYFSPLPPARSGIADYSYELLPYLAGHCAVTVYAADAEARAPEELPVRPLDDYPAARWDHDLALYHMGNSLYHDVLYDMVLRYPGVVVLHDFFLHHLLAERTTGRGDFPAYARELHYAHGPAGIALARQIRDHRAPMPLFDEPLNARLVDTSLGLIVHSEYAAAPLRERAPGLPLAVVAQPMTLLSESQVRARSRRYELGLADTAVVFAVVGQVTAAKQLPAVLKAVAALRASNPDVHLLIVGEILPEVDLDALIAEYALEPAVIRPGYAATLDEFVDWIATADAAINLRYPTLGETSAAALRALAAGRPLVVYDHGWYSEIPDGAAMKVPPLDDSALLAALSDLARSAAFRQQIGAAGARYVETACRPEAVAGAYATFLDSIVARWRAL